MNNTEIILSVIFIINFGIFIIKIDFNSKDMKVKLNKNSIIFLITSFLSLLILIIYFILYC